MLLNTCRKCPSTTITRPPLFDRGLQSWRTRTTANKSQVRTLILKSRDNPPKAKRSMLTRPVVIAASLVAIGGVSYTLYQQDYVQPLPATKTRQQIRAERRKWQEIEERKEKVAADNARRLNELPFGGDKQISADADESAWGSFSEKFAVISNLTDIQWGQTIAGYILPEWAVALPEYISKLQKEMSMAPGSLADEIWQEAHDSVANPEIEREARVRVSEDLCDEEKHFLARRREKTRVALARYLGLPDEEVHADDVPVIAFSGSGGGLRALVAGAGSMLAAKEDGLFDCVTYTAGVSGSCWMQTLYHTSVGKQSPARMIDHLKARIGTHIAYPPVALASLNQAPTNKFLLSGFVEKLKGDPNAEVGLVDVYGLLLAARLLVPKSEIGVNEHDLKISHQRRNLEHGDHPMPIYTAIRHEIPVLEKASDEEIADNHPSEQTKEVAKREAWFQWFEITPYELFCEEFSAGIPTWAIGRKFEQGHDLPQEDGIRVPELRLPLLMGVFGSAFCATLAHCYREIKPMVKGIAGFSSLEDMIEDRNDDLSKVHPINPASFPNFAYKMEGMLPETTPESIYKSTHLQLMDAGMSNNLPIYPLLRPGRDVDILVAFDHSADVKQDNWLAVADGYARQRGIKGWPIGVGWPKESDPVETTTAQLDSAQAQTAEEADAKVAEAKADQQDHLQDVADGKKAAITQSSQDSGDLGYCTVWVGTTEERSADTSEVQSKAVQEDWQLMQPDAGIAVVYFPYIKNPKVENVDPQKSEYMSTWNFVYTPEEIDSAVELARANFDEGKEQTRRCVRAVYERKKRIREEREGAERKERWRRSVRKGVVGRRGDGDLFV